MNNVLTTALIIVMGAVSVCAQSDSTSADSTSVAFQPVTVTAGLTSLPATRAPYSVAVIDSASLMQQPVRAVTDALAYVPGVDLRQRGAIGIQSDISIRGGTFEQTAVMLDGMRLNDVQTGHNTMSLPIMPSDVERIEVIKGGAARFFGAGALDGAVNIVLRQPTGTSTGTPMFKVSLTGGDAGLWEGRISTSLTTGIVGHQLGGQYLKHNGWQPNTDAMLASAMYRASVQTETTQASFILGVNAKEFGANGFYSPRFPDQWEKVTTYLGLATITTSVADDLDLTVRTSGRVNFDEFLLKRDDPSFYRNTHRTDQYQLQSGLQWYHEHGSTSVLLEGGHDAINSSNLGVHDRLRGNVMVEHVRMISNVRLSAGVGVLSFSDREPLITGGVEGTMNFTPTEQIVDVFYASVQRSGRIPTYTDLYYQDPQTTGNPDLLPEHAMTAEVGWRRSVDRYSVQAAVFGRYGTDLIDYAIDPATGKATAANITSVDIMGVDLSGTASINVLWLSSIRLGVLLQDVGSSAPTDTRYVADNLSVQCIMDTRWQLPLEIEASYILRVLERVTDPEVHVVHDVRCSRWFGMIGIMAEVTNISSEQYIETGWAVIPPRWFRFSVLVS